MKITLTNDDGSTVDFVAAVAVDVVAEPVVDAPVAEEAPAEVPAE